MPVRIDELPLHTTMVGRIFGIDSAGPPGSAVWEDDGISVGPTHTGDLLIHLGRATVGDEQYVGTPITTDDDE